jgi:hypothetical protein
MAEALSEWAAAEDESRPDRTRELEPVLGADGAAIAAVWERPERARDNRRGLPESPGGWQVYDKWPSLAHFGSCFWLIREP